MKNIKITLEYDGTDFCGWQIQKSPQPPFDKGGRGGISIQGSLESVLQKILHEKVRVIGSGRTDAGVHAIEQVAHFKTNSKTPLKKIQTALNSLLTPSIVIKKIEEVPLDFHAQISAKKKLYMYFILNDELPSVFFDRYCWQIKYPLDWKKMKRALKILKGEHDFKSFQSVGTELKSTVREIRKIEIRGIRGIPAFAGMTMGCHSRAGGNPPCAHGNPLYSISIEANGFLKQMVRNIVGTLVEVGRGKISIQDLKKILNAKDRRKAGLAAPAKGLFLMKVDY